MKTLACCRRRPQDFSIDMDQEPDSKPEISNLPRFCFPASFFFYISFSVRGVLARFMCVQLPHCLISRCICSFRSSFLKCMSWL